eukprot:7165376-Prymnesium_polylepis.1
MDDQPRAQRGACGARMGSGAATSECARERPADNSRALLGDGAHGESAVYAPGPRSERSEQGEPHTRLASSASFAARRTQGLKDDALRLARVL